MMYTIGEFAKKIGKTTQTLRDWERKKILIPSYKTKGRHRMYSEEQLQEVLQKKNLLERINVGYCRVSSKHQSEDLKRQITLLELYLAKQGKVFKIISDTGSGINYNKKGLDELIKLVSRNQIEKIYILHKDRLIRFGFELIEKFCFFHNTEIEVINKSPDKSDEEELVEDILNIIHVFSCKINGKRSHLNKKIIERLSKNEQKDNCSKGKKQ